MASLELLPRWDLTDFYPSIDDETLALDIQNATNEATLFQKMYEGVFQKKEWTPPLLLEAIQRFERIEEKIDKLLSFAYLHYSVELTNQKVLQFFQSIQEKTTVISSLLLFFPLELAKVEEEKLCEAYQTNLELRFYKPWMDSLRLLRPYQLEDKLEKLLHEKSLTSQHAWVRLYDETLARMTFPLEGESLSLTQILDLLSHREGQKRKAAALALNEGLKEKLPLFTLIINTLVKDKEMEDQWRGYPHPVCARNLSNQVEDTVVEALAETVKKNYPALSHRYYKLKAHCLGLDSLEYWDRNAPLPGGDEALIPWDKACQIVLTSYRDFSPEMADIGDCFFKKGWIDAPALSTKYSGAFAHPTIPSIHPYILLNYQGKLRDVMTLSHELGHGIHQVLASKQGGLLSKTPLTIAETASVFGEMLTFRSLLSQTTSRSQRRSLIGAKIEDMLNTSVRQIAFFDFEKQVHHRRQMGELSPEDLSHLWITTQREALGGHVQLESTSASYWSYISHFIHAPFYVYAYAFGDCLVNTLYSLYQQGYPEFTKKYLALLSAGGSQTHQSLLAPFHLDARDPTFWQIGLNVIIQLIDDFESLLDT